MGGRSVAILAVTSLVLMFGTTPAFADTSASTAQAINLSLLGASAVNSGLESASNPGNGAPTDTEGANPALSILGTQSTLTAGVLAQTAVADGDGTSAACAGLVGAGGTIQIGTDGTCTVTGGGAGGVTLVLPDLVTVTATAILEECTASSTGTPTATAQFLDANVTVFGNPAVSIPVNPSAGSSQSAALLSLGLNVQSTPIAGEIQGTALSLNVADVVGLNIGTVTCGPDAATVPSSAFPVKSLPIAGGVALLLAAVGVPWYRRRRLVG